MSSGRSLLLVSEAEESQASCRSRSRSCDELTPASHKTGPGISPPRLAPHLSHPLRGQFFSTVFFLFIFLSTHFNHQFICSYITCSTKLSPSSNFWSLFNSLRVTIQQSIQSDSKLSWIISTDILLNQLIDR